MSWGINKSFTLEYVYRTYHAANTNASSINLHVQFSEKHVSDVTGQRPGAR